MGSYFYIYYLDWPGNTPSEWFQYYHSVKNNYPNTIYAHFFKENSEIIVQYWFFYPFNDFLNNHEGDWEHINVVIDSQIPEDADIIKVDYYFHHFVLIRHTPGVDFYTVDNTHPVIFVGGYSGLADGWGSHGCYSIMGA